MPTNTLSKASKPKSREGTVFAIAFLLIILLNCLLIAFIFQNFDLNSANQELASSLLISENAKQALQVNLTDLGQNYGLSQNRQTGLLQQIVALQNEKIALANQLTQAKNKESQLAAQYLSSLKPPYTSWLNGTVTVTFKKINGDLATITWPTEAFEQTFIRSYLLRQDPRYVDVSTGSKKVQAIDFRPFVDPHFSSGIAKQIYAESGSAEKYAAEVFNMVKQITVYSDEIRDTPRLPGETLAEGSGDCEDTAILVASFLKAADASWKVQLVYMDEENPSNPQTINHVAVKLIAGNYSTLIETTSKTQMNPYTEEVKGDYYDV